MNRIPLSQVCNYSDDSVQVSELNLNNFISTDNMLPNRGGITEAVNLPPANSCSAYSKGEILISNIRPYFKKIWFAEFNGGCSADVLVLKTTNPKFDPKFVYYNLFQDLFFKHQMTGSKGSKMPRGDKDQIMTFLIPEFDKTYQKRVSEFLNVIDEKIALNKEINTELENLAKTIFNYWFVQFDFPNEEGKPYKTSGGEMEWNDELKREIPKGWRAKSLYDIATYTNGLAMQKHRPKGEERLPVIKIKEMNEGYSAATEYARPDIEDDYLIKDGDILFSWSASLNIMIWADKIGALNQHIFKVTSVNYPRYYFYHQISNYLNHFKLMAENRKTTMGHITIDHLKESRIVVPNDDLLIKKCGERIEPLLDLIVKNRMTNIELMEIRDFLLPMLMNGQVKVKSEVNEQLSMAAEPQVKYMK